MIKISALSLPRVRHPSTVMPLYPHQAFMLDEWHRNDTFLLVAKTGTGKTAGAILPVLKSGKKAICVYPTNELIRDQADNIARLARREGLAPCLLTPDTDPKEIVSANTLIVRVDGPTLEDWRKALHLRSKGEALERLLFADKQRIVLTNPDVLFLILSLRYQASALADLRAYETLIVDEFHLYAGVELAHALAMISVARGFNTFRRVVLLSATPHCEVADILDQLFGPKRVDSSVSVEHEKVDVVLAVHEVEVHPRLKGLDVVDTAAQLIAGLLPELAQRRQRNGDSQYVPAVVVLNSVVNAIHLEDRLIGMGIPPPALGAVRGLTGRGVRDSSRSGDTLILVGTSAVEVGIDFTCDYLIFEASEAASFMQRFGRVGRHNPGVAYVLCPHNVLKGMDSLESTIDRALFEERVYTWYPSDDTGAWFVSTDSGLLTAFAFALCIVNLVRDDPRSTDAQVRRVREHVLTVMQEHAEKLRVAHRVRGVLSQFSRAEQPERHRHLRWLGAYQRLNTFRTSLPSEWVLDSAEQKRRGYDLAKYTVDIGTLLRRAEGLHYDEKEPHPDGGKGMLVVKGYGRYKNVRVVGHGFTNDKDPYGLLESTANCPEMKFLQQGHPTSVSHVMRLREHVFTIVPDDVKSELDWRLPVFQCDLGLIAFDGAALLLKEHYGRNKKSAG